MSLRRRFVVAMSQQICSGSAEDPLVLDRAESPEYHTPPIASSPLASPVTTPLKENFIPLPVRLDLGTSPSVDSKEENRPPCCQVPRLPLAPLLETSEDEVLTVSDIRRAIVRARYSGRFPGLTRTLGTSRKGGRPSQIQRAVRSKGRIIPRGLRGSSQGQEPELEGLSNHRPDSSGLLPQDVGGQC